MATTKRKTRAKTRTTTKRKTATKTTARQSTKRKPTAKKVTVGKKPFTKTELFLSISDTTGLSRKEVGSVFDQFCTIIFAHVKGSAKQFTIPGIGKIVVNRKPATKARKGINPFTGEPTVFKAKPARNVVKIRPLKALKEAAK